MSEPSDEPEEPFGDGGPTYYVKVTAANFTSEAVPYVIEGVSRRVEWYADGSVFIDGVKVREAWWRRALNWVDARLTLIRHRG